MFGKFVLSEVFTIIKEEGAENAYQSNATNFSNSGDKVEVAIDLLNITNIFQAILNLAPTTSTNASEPDIFFYVEMPQSPTTPTNNQQNELVVNLDDSSPKLNVLIIPS